TITHANLGRADEETVEWELRESLAMLNRALGERSRPFSFPWGGPADMSPHAVEAARRAGYYAVASTWGGRHTRGDDPFQRRRIDADNGCMELRAWRARNAGLSRNQRAHPDRRAA